MGLTKKKKVNEPKPISDDDDEIKINSSEKKGSVALCGSSRLFTPYRSLGILSDGMPFYFLSGQTTNMIVLSIGNRFQIVKTDKLQPVLVSESVSHRINRLISDSSLSLTAVAHGGKRLTLFSRLTPFATRKLCGKRHEIVDLLHLGHMQMEGTGEKEGKTENAMIIAAILSQKHDNSDDKNEIVPIVNTEESSDDDSSIEIDDDDISCDDNTSGYVVIVIATRTSLIVQNQIKVPIHPKVALHPSTYINKIILGGHDGLVLVNIKSGSIIHKFKCVPKNDVITSLEQSPAIDTVAVGCASGNVHLINLRQDKRLFGLKHSSEVVSLSFRTDSSALQHNVAPLAVGLKDGAVFVWDLSPSSEDNPLGRTVLFEIKNLHPGGVSCLKYLPQEPVLLSIGKKSNCILMHIFDAPDHSGRLWKSRKGHTSPPQCISYLYPATNGLAFFNDGTDAAACQILSGGSKDRTLRIFSSARSILDKEYSQGQGLEKKSKKFGYDSVAEFLLPPVIAMASCQARSRNWGDLVTIHQNHTFCYVWSTKRGAQSGPILRQDHWNVSTLKTPPPRSTHATCVAMSSCGNYAIVGTKGGIIYRYNVQSGISRGQYPYKERMKKGGKKLKAPGDIDRTMKSLEKKFKVSNRKSDQDKEERDAIVELAKERRLRAKLFEASHQNSQVTGLAVDAVNKTLISVGDDAKLILWNFLTHAPHKKSPYILPAPATKLNHIRDSDLAAVALKDFSVILFDCSALQIVRRFGDGHHNHSGPISDLAFAPDGRTLYTASFDRTIRVWDVPTNHCIDWMSFSTAPTSLTVSPTGEFIATTHADSLGISMWGDRSFYQTVFVDGAPLEPAEMDEPVPMAEITEGNLKTDDTAELPNVVVEKIHERDDAEGNPPQPKEAGMVTMSGLPVAHWKNLFHLELVKERNKPKEPPKKPPTAPFFLQHRSGESILDSPIPQQEKENILEDDKEWSAAWSDDDADPKLRAPDQKRALSKDAVSQQPAPKKRRMLTHHRSHLAALLLKNDYKAVTDYMGTLGPSAIDVSLSTLCNGMHDLELGLILLIKAAEWLLEESRSKERYEAINSYLHRFIYLHSNVIAGIKENAIDEERQLFPEEEKRLLKLVEQLRDIQVSDKLKDKMQHSLCLLRHFLRMV